MTDREWKLGSCIELNGKTFEVYKISVEPNIGFVSLVEISSTAKTTCTIPTEMFDTLYEHHMKLEFDPSEK